MEIRALEYFLAVAREQNITAAAESLHISQPALSTQLKTWRTAGKAAFNSWGKRLTQSHTDRGRDDPPRKRAEEILSLVHRTEEEITRFR